MSAPGAVDLVICDMAGTTIDDHGLVYDALRSSVEETGAVVAESDLQQWMGTEKSAAIRALMELGGRPADGDSVSRAFARFLAILGSLYAEAPPVALPGAESALAELRGIGMRVALTTGFTHDVAATVLGAVGWQVGGQDGVVDALVTASEVAAGRPAPYLIFHAMEQLGIDDVARVVSVGDTVVDLLSAARAGVAGVGVTSGALDEAGFGDTPRSAILAGVSELPAWLRSSAHTLTPAS